MTGTPNTSPPPGHVPGQLPPFDVDDRAAALREQLDALNAQQLAAKLDALADVEHRAAQHATAGQQLDEAVNAARAYGATWREIAGAVGLTVSATWERWAHR